MRRAMRSAMAAMLAGSAVCACDDGINEPEGLPAAFAVVVSNPVIRSEAAAAGAVGSRGPATSLASADGSAFVSMAPGTQPLGTGAAIVNRRTRESMPAPIADGGFDPVGIRASAGDTIDITVALSTGDVALTRTVVPVRRPPRVVRTSPPRGRTDVALNTKVTVIFSEPIDRATLDGGTIRLLRGGAAVEGSVGLVGSGVGVEFVPSAPLAPATAYQLVIADRITDLAGERLEATATTEFTTTAGPVPAGPVPPDPVPADPVPATAQLVFTTQPTDAVALGPFARPLVVTALNPAGGIDLSFNRSVTLTLGAHFSGTAALLGQTSVVAVNGVATFPGLAVSTASPWNTLVASAPGASDGVSTGFLVTSNTSPWVPKAHTPTLRSNAAAAVVDGIIYLIGGDNVNDFDFQLVTTVEAYDPATNTWTEKAPMPTPRNYLAAGVVNGIIYVIGGIDASGTVGTVEAYDPGTNTWTTRAPMPTARSTVAVGVLNGTLYAVGGGIGGRIVEAYDPAMDSWTRKADMPTGRAAAAIGAVNGLLYLIGGALSDGSSTAAVEAYDPTADTWTSRQPMPTPRSFLGAAVVDNTVYAMGGNSWPVGIPFAGEVEAYDPATNSWRSGPALPVSFTTLGAVVDGVIYAMVGKHVFAYRP